MFKAQNTDQDILNACIQGDTQAFEAIVDKYQSLVCAITYSGTRRFDTSEELAQETFLLAWKNLNQLKDLSRFQAWLCRIARSTVQNWFRTQKRNVTESAAPLEVAQDQATVKFEPTQIALQKEQQDVVNQALSHIPNKYREALILFYREENSTREVANKLEVSEANARQRIARARTMLKDQVATMVETTLTQSKPGKAFTGVVMASIVGSGLKRSIAATTMGSVASSTGISTLITSVVGKAVIVAASFTILAGGILLYQNRTNKPTTSNNSEPQVFNALSPNTPADPNTAKTAQAPTNTNNITIRHSLATTAPKEVTTNIDIPTQTRPLTEPQSPSQPPPILQGKVTDKDTGAPIKNINIELVLSGGGRIHSEQTDANGVYKFQTLPQNGTYSISPDTYDYITPASWEAPTETIDLNKDKPAKRDIVLEKGCKVLIHAVDENGSPVKRVNLFAAYVSDERGRGPKSSVRTNDNGKTFIGGLRPDEYLIVGAHPDYALVGKKIKFDGSKQITSITFTMEKGIEISGLATCADNLPASGWEVRAYPIWWNSTRSWPYDDPVTEDGHFRFKHILPGLHNVQVYIPKDGGSTGIWSTQVNLPSETGLLELKITHHSPHGRVSQAGEVVFIGEDYQQGFWIHGRSTTESDASIYLSKGKRQFMLNDLVPGLYDFYITIQGKRIDFKNIAIPQDLLLFEVPTISTSNLRAQVIDKRTGKPISVFQISLDRKSWRQITDPNGLIEITTYSLEPQHLYVRVEGLAETISKPIVPDSEESIIIEMDTVPNFFGQIYDERGNPIVGATVNYRYSRRPNEDPNEKRITTTNVHGKFSMQVGPTRDNKEWFVFKHPDYAHVTRQLSLENPASGFNIIMTKGGTLQGHLYNWQGLVCPNTPIYFMDESSAFSYWKQNRARLGRVVTDSQGYYRIDHLPAELCYAYFGNTDQQMGIAATAVLPQELTVRTFDIGGTWCVRGRILKDGLPLPNAPVRIIFEEGVAQGFKANQITNALGEFSFFGIPTGTRSLYCAVDGNRGRRVWVKLYTHDFKSSEDINLGDLALKLHDVHVELIFDDPTMSQKAWDLYIKHNDPESSWGRRVGQLAPRMHTDDPYVFQHVPLGTFEAIAKCDEYSYIHHHFTVSESKPATIKMKIPTGAATLTGKVIPHDPQVRYYSLMLRNPDLSLTHPLRIDNRGSFLISNLPAGPYIIGRENVAKSRESSLVEFELKPGENKYIEIPYSLNQTGHNTDGYLTVTIVTDEGIPLALDDIWLERDGITINPHYNTDDSKSFMGEPGTYTLYAQYPGFIPLQTPVTIQSKEERVKSHYAPLVITMVKQ